MGVSDAPTLIGLCGYAQVGKDSVATILSAYGFERRAFADKLRSMAYAIDPIVQVGAMRGEHERLRSLVDEVGWDRAKQYGDVRRFLQRLGTEGVREHLGETTWIDALELASRTVVTDCRFPNEAEFIRRNGGVVWRVTRDCVTPVEAHVSEEQKFPADRIIRNDGSLADLAQEVARALQEDAVEHPEQGEQGEQEAEAGEDQDLGGEVLTVTMTEFVACGASGAPDSQEPSSHPADDSGPRVSPGGSIHAGAA